VYNQVCQTLDMANVPGIPLISKLAGTAKQVIN